MMHLTELKLACSNIFRKGISQQNPHKEITLMETAAKLDCWYQVRSPHWWGFDIRDMFATSSWMYHVYFFLGQDSMWFFKKGRTLNQLCTFNHFYFLLKQTASRRNRWHAEHVLIAIFQTGKEKREMFGLSWNLPYILFSSSNRSCLSFALSASLSPDISTTLGGLPLCRTSHSLPLGRVSGTAFPQQ